MMLHDVIIRPVITEKSTALAETGKYVFHVHDDAPQARIKEAVEAEFGVRVRAVHVATVHGKRKRYGRRLTQRPSWKKAIVTLQPGERIEIFGAA